MSRSRPTKEAYDSLIYNLATLESELGQARKLLEAPAKAPWWKRFWGGKALIAVLLLVMVMVGGAGGGSGVLGVHEWNILYKSEKVMYAIGYGHGMVTGAFHQEQDPKLIKRVFDCIDKWTYEQTVAILDKYFRDNPHKWGKPFHLLVWESQIDACKKR